MPFIKSEKYLVLMQNNLGLTFMMAMRSDSLIEFLKSRSDLLVVSWPCFKAFASAATESCSNTRADFSCIIDNNNCVFS